MKRILAMAMTLCMVLCTLTPVMAAAAPVGEIPIGQSGLPAEESEATLEAAGFDEDADAGDGGADADVDVDADAQLPQEDAALPDAEPEDAPEVEDTPEPAPVTIDTILYSEFVGGDYDYYTRIRLVATDREGNPVEGAVYGLYTYPGWEFVQELHTWFDGTATSDDISVDTDYILLEEIAPEGFLPNEESREIYLTDLCAPSRVDVKVEYDPIMGQIGFIKVDENGNRLSGAGFEIYSMDNGFELADTVVTDENGEALSIPLRYGWYEIYEYLLPGEEYAPGERHQVFVSEHDAIFEIEVVNYLATGSARLYKTGNDGRSVAGAVFGIFDAATEEWLEDVTTNGSGYAYTGQYPVGEYFAVERSVPAPYRLDDTRHYFTIEYAGQQVNLTIENVVDGDGGYLQINKTDDTENPLGDIVFGLYRAWDNRKLTELVTAADGTAQYGPLIPGDYYLIEQTGAAGYEMVSGQIPFTVDGSGETVTLHIENPRIRVFGKVQAVKTDDAGAPLAGVRLGLFCVAADNLLEELVTAEDGTATSGILNQGDYYLMELEGATGHQWDAAARYPFSITDNGVTVPVQIENPRITGGVRVLKTDGGETPLADVVFGIFYAGGDDMLHELVTGEDGVAESPLLYYGDYELRELSGVEGFEQLDASIPFSILEQGVVLEIPVANPLILGGVSVMKVAEEDMAVAVSSADAGEPTGLPGAVFGLYNEQGQKLAELTCGEDGRAVYQGLPKGRYYLKELIPPAGRVLLDELLPFEIITQGQMVSFVVPNAQGYGTILVEKHGEGEMLAGVSFDVYRQSDDALLGELVTGEGDDPLQDGTAALTLPLGGYYLRETATAEGYRLAESALSFALTEDGATVTLPVQNQKLPPSGGYILLTKSDSEDANLLLSGATFGIYRAADDVRVGSMTTGPDGTVTSGLLPAAEYYLLEEKQPEGYLPSDTKTGVTVVEGETAEITVSNRKAPDENGTVIVNKWENGTERGLAGAVFGVYRTGDDGKVGEITTGSDGRGSLSLAPSDYYLLELVAPTGFRRSTERTSFSLTAGGTRELTVYNRAVSDTGDEDEDGDGNLLIIKTAEGTGDYLEGAVFGVYRKSNNEKVDEVETDADGRAWVTLERGDYYLRELRAPSGFSIERAQIAFRISNTDRVVRVSVTNTRGIGTLRLEKSGPEDEAVPEAEFTVHRASSGTQVAELITGSDGAAVLQLPAGSYYLVERSVQAPYILDSSRHSFTIQAGRTETVAVVNEKQGSATATPEPATPQPTPAGPDGSGDSGIITVPQTGEALPYLNYTLAALCMAAACWLGALLLRDHKRRAQQ